MSDDHRIPEAERVEAVARRLLADVAAYARGPIGLNSHSCMGYDDELRCRVCGRDGRRAPDVVTLFVGVLGQWWVNGAGGGRPIDYVPANLVLPVLRGYLAQQGELRRLRAERGSPEGIDQTVERALQSFTPGIEDEAATGELSNVRSVADAVWAIGKGFGVSRVGRRLKGLASRLHELATQPALRGEVDDRGAGS